MSMDDGGRGPPLAQRAPVGPGRLRRAPNAPLAPRWNLRAGARLDRRGERRARRGRSRASGGAACARATPSSTARERPTSIAATRWHRGTCCVEWQPARAACGPTSGAGVTSRAPGITERYFAFAPARGGFLVGDPGARSRSSTWSSRRGSTGAAPHLEASLVVFHTWFDDFILKTLIAMDGCERRRRPRRDPGLPQRVGAHLRLRGERDAAAAGRHFSVPVTLSYVRARNTSDGRALPEVPPLGGDRGAALRVWRPRTPSGSSSGLASSPDRTASIAPFPRARRRASRSSTCAAASRFWSGLHIRARYREPASTRTTTST